MKTQVWSQRARGECICPWDRLRHLLPRPPFVGASLASLLRDSAIGQVDDHWRGSRWSEMDEGGSRFVVGNLIFWKRCRRLVDDGPRVWEAFGATSNPHHILVVGHLVKLGHILFPGVE